MGKRGVPPKPRALRLIDGTHPERINANEPIPAGGVPEPPAGMAAAVREVWNYTVGQLDAMGIAVACDRDALVCYCEAVVNHREASKLLARSDVLIKGIHGNPVRNPALAVQRDSANLIRAFAQEFGLTPSARTRIEVDRATVAAAHGQDDNPFAGNG